MKFKKGDLVKIVKSHSNYKGRNKLVGVITKVDGIVDIDKTTYSLEATTILGNNGKIRMYWEKDELQLVEVKRMPKKFKVGDRVIVHRLTGNSNSLKKKYLGKKTKIIEDDVNSSYPYKLEFEDMSYNYFWWDDCELELVDSDVIIRKSNFDKVFKIISKTKYFTVGQREVLKDIFKTLCWRKEENIPKIGDTVKAKDLQKGWIVEIVDKVAKVDFSKKIAEVIDVKNQKEIYGIDFKFAYDYCHDLLGRIKQETGRFPEPDDLFTIKEMPLDKEG